MYYQVVKKFERLQKLRPGDRVAVVSPSAGLPGRFPWVQDLGLQRMQNVFRLEPVEYPTTRLAGAPLMARAQDLMAAFANPQIKAIFASVGGDDQIKLLKHLDTAVIRRNPKPFFGYSDNTHLHTLLWNLGVPSYYGGSVMTQLAMQKAMHEETVEFMRHALFDRGEYEISATKGFNDINLEWGKRSNLTKSRTMETNEGWFWDGATSASGLLWGGCVESLIEQFSAGVYLPSAKDLTGTALYIETAEDIPEHWITEYLMTGLGERGWLNKFQAVLVGRPKAWERNKQNPPQWRKHYRQKQRETVLRIVREYSDIPVVQNLDFGHTDPQVVLPSGGSVRLDSTTKKIFLAY